MNKQNYLVISVCNDGELVKDNGCVSKYFEMLIVEYAVYNNKLSSDEAIQCAIESNP